MWLWFFDACGAEFWYLNVCLLFGQKAQKPLKEKETGNAGLYSEQLVAYCNYM